MTWNSSEMPLPPSLSRATREISSALDQVKALASGGRDAQASELRRQTIQGQSPRASMRSNAILSLNVSIALQ